MAEHFVPPDRLDEIMQEKNFVNSPPIPWLGIFLAVTWLIPPLMYWLSDTLARQRKRKVTRGVDPTLLVSQEEQEADLSEVENVLVMLASLEHSLPQYVKARAVAGGLGKVVDMISRHHPTDIFMIHPMVGTSEKVSYGEPAGEDKPLKLNVDGIKEVVKVFRHVWYPDGPEGIKVDFLMLGHPMFESRTKESIYPNPMSRRKVLHFFSLWNQAVGALIVRHQPQIFHCPDFHTAVAPWYAVPKYPRLKILLVLHNAEYMGGIQTTMIRGERLNQMAKIWNLPVELVKKHLVCDGRLNMLKSAVDFVVEHQDGIGVCAVSHYYAEECYTTYSLLWSLPRIDGLDNPMLEEERATLVEPLDVTKRKAKAEIQQFLGLNVDPSARIFVSLGRLVRQKGVDVIADVTPWILDNFPSAQVCIIGPIGDGFGHYAARKLQILAEEPRYNGRVFIKCEFMKVPENLKFAADFCLMPSRDEPFGYVDIEFAWRGSLLVGAQAGGLGKVPGFYYVAQNKENLNRLRHELEAVIRQAMEASNDELAMMADEALKCDFPLPQWQRKLKLLYRNVLDAGPQVGAAGMDVEMQGVKTSARTGDSQDAEAGDSKAASNRSRLGSPSTNSITVGGTPTRAKSLAQPETFNPYDRRTTRALPGGLPMGQMPTATGPVSMIDVGTTLGQINEQMEAVWSCADEFLVQELPEEEIATRVQDKLSENPNLSIDVILEMIGSEVDMERETTDAIARWHLKLTYGIANVHWCVSIGYIATPIAEFLTFVTAAEWGLRGGAEFPAWFKAFPWFKTVFGNGGLDSPILAFLLFTANCLGFLIGTPIWTFLCMYVEPRYLMGCSLLLQVPLLVMIFPISPNLTMAFFLKFAHGLVGSAGLLFICFNFMMAIKGDMSQAAVRMGMLEMARFSMGWLLTGYVFLASPGAMEGEEGAPLPWAVTLLLLPIAFLAILCTLVPGVLLFWAPGPYRDDRLPGLDLVMLGKKKSFLLMALSDLIGALALFPSTCYVSWWIANGWTNAELIGVSIFCAMFLAVGTLMWAYALHLAAMHGFSFLIGTSILLAPGFLLRSVVQEEVSLLTNVGKSNIAMLISVFSLLIEGVRASATWTAKIKILNSRWRMLSYGTLLVTVMQLVALFSPYLSEYIARQNSVSFITRNQKELADAVIVCVIPIGIAQFTAQVLSAFYIQKDMGVIKDVGRTDEVTAITKWYQRTPVLVAVACCLTAFISGGLLHYFIVSSPLDYIRVSKCTLDKIPKNCKKILDERSDPGELTNWDNGLYGLNEHGSISTGRFNCRHRTIDEGGNTMVFELNRCVVYDCGSGPLAQPEVESKDAEVWSTRCSQVGQNYIAVHLMEWRWEDIGRECTDYLGPTGFDVVQVTPPSEHVLGSSWYTRYSAVSYKLESRSGSRKDFINMVTKCREAGVSIMVDAVFNHMASTVINFPEKNKGKQCGGEVDNATHATQKCAGWYGTDYANREFLENTHRMDRFEKRNFHHYQANRGSNCGIPPWTNNRHTCDLFGLPDLDTESHQTIRMIQAYLMDLYAIGVTMLRIDAALNIYPQSLATILQPFPWHFIVQEYYPGMLYIESGTLSKAKMLGAITDFTFGQRVAEAIFPGRTAKDCPKDAKKNERDGTCAWESRSNRFGDLLHLFQARIPNCEYNVCDSPIPSEHALLFLDNHDQQRERWKPVYHPKPETGTCWWNGKLIVNCRPIWKHGHDYNLAQLFMLAWPYGDAVRVTSSYWWSYYQQGPPGTVEDGLRDITASAFEPDGVHHRCKPTPSESPISMDWEQKTEAYPWICEHRWEGVAGLVRLRRLVGKSHKVTKTFSEAGHISFNFGNVAFLAFNQGYNWWTKTGKKDEWDIAGRETGLPNGRYCNLASVSVPVEADPAQFKARICKRAVSVENGKIKAGSVPSAGVVALHENYRDDQNIIVS